MVFLQTSPLEGHQIFLLIFFSSFQFLPNLRYLEVRNTTGRNIFLFLRDELQDDEAGKDDLGESAVLESETSCFFVARFGLGNLQMAEEFRNVNGSGGWVVMVKYDIFTTEQFLVVCSEFVRISKKHLL